MALEDEKWVTPKTDWLWNDYFNKSDYNRIVGNLKYLNELAVAYLDEYTGIYPDYTEYTDTTQIWNADDFNLIENALEYINANTAVFDIGDTVTFYANGQFITNSELNRIESYSLAIANAIKSNSIIKTRLAFRLGAEREVKT